MIDLIGKKYYFFALSILIMIAGLIGYFVNGLNLDIQFEGGTVIQMQMQNDNYDTTRAEKVVKDTLGKDAVVQKLTTYNIQNGNSKIYLMDVKIAGTDITQQQRSDVQTTLRSAFEVSSNANITVNSIAPFIGDQFKSRALHAIFWASLIIILYVWWRFKVMSGLSILISIITVFVMASINNIQSIKDFTFPLIIGITSGCYSSIFIASSLYVVWKERKLKVKRSQQSIG